MPDPRSQDSAAQSDHAPTLTEVVERLDRLWSEDRVSRPISLTDPIGRSIAKYEIRRVIGCGAFGVVYHARDVELKRDVALKLPRPEVMLDAERLRRFQDEATMTASLDHPLIVPIYEADLKGPAPYIASAFCAGPDLGEWLDERTTPVPAHQAAEFVAELADAVHYAHEHGVLHRDLKPSNVLLEPKSFLVDSNDLANMQPRLTDFGLAKLVGNNTHETKSSLIIGTPLYLAPEQLNGRKEEPSTRSDVYALGVLLFELLTLQTPFQGDSYTEVLDAIRSTEAPRLRDCNTRAPNELETICETCLAKDPGDRYPSAADVRDELRRFTAGEPILAKPVTCLDRFERWCRSDKRLQVAGRISVAFQAMLILWTPAVALASHLANAVTEEIMARSLRDYAFVALCIHIPILLASWLLLRKKRWAYWYSLLGNLMLTLIFSHAAVTNAIAFEYNYPTRLSKLTVLVPLILACVGVTLLHVVALPAWLRSARQRR